MTERLDAFLSRNGFGSRAETRELVRRGRVTVDGRGERDPARHIGDQVVAVRGQAVQVLPDSVTLLAHKAVGYSCSHDVREAPLLFDLVPPPFDRLAVQAAGRLDRDTSGLIVLTTDGQLIHALTNPKKACEKRYRIGYAGELAADAVQRVASGIALDGEQQPTLPARLVMETPRDGLRRATLWLREGRFHQVRRMIAALGGEVVTLHRDAIAGLELPAELAPGDMRVISDDELRRLRSVG